MLQTVTSSFLPFIFVLPATNLTENTWWYTDSTFSVQTSQVTTVHRIQWPVTVFRNQTQNVNTPQNKPIAEHDPLTVPVSLTSNKPSVIMLFLLDVPHQLCKIINYGVGILHFMVNATFSRLHIHTHRQWLENTTLHHPNILISSKHKSPHCKPANKNKILIRSRVQKFPAWPTF